MPIRPDRDIMITLQISSTELEQRGQGGVVMDEYTTASCSTCKQAIYLARRKLDAAAWVCPACGSENVSLDTKRPAYVAVSPSRFARTGTGI